MAITIWIFHCFTAPRGIGRSLDQNQRRSPWRGSADVNANPNVIKPVNVKFGEDDELCSPRPRHCNGKVRAPRSSSPHWRSTGSSTMITVCPFPPPPLLPPLTHHRSRRRAVSASACPAAVALRSDSRAHPELREIHHSLAAVDDDELGSLRTTASLVRTCTLWLSSRSSAPQRCLNRGIRVMSAAIPSAESRAMLTFGRTTARASIAESSGTSRSSCEVGFSRAVAPRNSTFPAAP